LEASRAPKAASLRADSYLAYLTRNSEPCTELRQHVSGEFARHAIIRYVEDLPREELALRGGWLTELPALVRLSDRSALMGRHAVAAAAQLAHWFTAAAIAAAAAREGTTEPLLPDASTLLLGPLAASVDNGAQPTASLQPATTAAPCIGLPRGSMFCALPSYAGMAASTAGGRGDGAALTPHVGQASAADDAEVDDWGLAWTRSAGLTARDPINRNALNRPRLSLLTQHLLGANGSELGRGAGSAPDTQDGSADEDDDFGLPYRTTRWHPTVVAHGGADPLRPSQDASGSNDDDGADDGWGNAFM
jgi:hypothetical protein